MLLRIGLNGGKLLVSDVPQGSKRINFFHKSFDFYLVSALSHI